MRDIKFKTAFIMSKKFEIVQWYDARENVFRVEIVESFGNGTNFFDTRKEAEDCFVWVMEQLKNGVVKKQDFTINSVPNLISEYKRGEKNDK